MREDRGQGESGESQGLGGRGDREQACSYTCTYCYMYIISIGYIVLETLHGILIQKVHVLDTASI